MKNKKYEIYLVILASGISLTSISTIWSPTQGWYLEWATYWNDGLVPYKDFFFPLPPLYLFVYKYILYTPDPLLFSRFFDLAIVVLLNVGLYKLLNLKFKTFTAFFVTATVMLWWQINPTNTISGYFEFACCLLVWGLYFLLGQGGAFKFVISGMLIAASSLVKQNYVFTVTSFTILSFIYILFFKGPQVKRLILLLVGFLLTYILLLFYLVRNDLLSLFIETMLQGGGKNLEFSNLVRNLVIEVVRPQTAVTFLILIFSIVTFARMKKFSTFSIRFTENLALGFYILSTLFFIYFYSIGSVPQFLFRFLILYLLFIVTLSIVNRIRILQTFYWVSPIFIVVGSWVISNSSLGYLLRIERLNNGLANFSSFLGSMLWSLSIAVLLLFAYKALLYKNDEKYFSGFINNEITKDYAFISVVLSLFLGGLINAYNGSAFIDSNIILCAILLSALVDGSLSTPKNRARLISFVWLPLSLSSVFITTTPYSWYGWTETTKTQNISNNLELFKNFKLTKQQTNFYEEVHNVVNRISTKSINKNLTIAQVPAQPILMNLNSLNHYKMFCPIMHIDVCPESASRVDLENFKEDPPDVFLYYSFGDGALLSFEDSFRDGKKSNIRRIEEWVNSGSAMKLEDKIEVPNTPDSFLYIYSKT
jgi:hypothetical protein